MSEEQAVYQSKKLKIPKIDPTKTPLTDLRTYRPPIGIINVVAADWARQLERDVRILALRLLAEDAITFAPETAEVMDRWKPEILKALKGES